MILRLPPPITILNRRIEIKIQPLRDRVLVVGIEEKEKTAGGIIIPDTAKENPQARHRKGR
jgi:hypothetical protein